MKYRIYIYKDDGDFLNDFAIRAKSYKKAAQHGWFLIGSAGHVAVAGKKVRRYQNGKLLHVPKPTLHRFQKGSKYAIMVLIGNISETHYTKDKELRDKIWQSMASEFAKPATPDEQLKNIIVFLDELKDSKSTSMSPKTSKKFVVSVMPPVDWTPIGTDKPSTKDSAGDTEKPTWPPGSNPSPSRPAQIFAKVKPLKEHLGSPGVNAEMVEMAGLVIPVKKSHFGLWKGAGWNWREEWLEFVPGNSEYEHLAKPGWQPSSVPSHAKLVKATVKRLPTDNQQPGINFQMQKLEGKTLWFYKTEPYYTALGWQFKRRWLEFEKPVWNPMFYGEPMFLKNPYFTGSS